MKITERQQKVQVCKNWVRRIVGVKTVDERRMDELRVEVGVKGCFKKKLVRRNGPDMWKNDGDGKYAKRADA